MKLFYAPASPFARKARIVARELDLMNDIDEITAAPYQDDPRLLAVTPAGLVPALSLDDGTVLIDSPLICQHLDAMATSSSMIGETHGGRMSVLQHEALADAIMEFALAAVVENRRTDSAPSPTFIERKLSKVKRCIASLPTAPTDMSGPLSLGDIATVCALGYLDFRLPDLDWRADRPDLATWHAAVDARPAFVETRPADLPA